MYPKLTTALIILLTCWGMNTKAQYVPKTQRKSTSQLHTIKIKRGEQITVKRSTLYCDTLIMEEESTLKVPHTFISFTLYAKYCKIGNGCVISSRGRNGKVGVVGKYNDQGRWQGKIAEAGSNAPHLNLYLNIYALGNLIIDATGGNGATAQTPLNHTSDNGKHNLLQPLTRFPGVCGSGGNVNLQYYSPLIVSFKKKDLKHQRKRKRKKRQKKNQIIVGNTIGTMNLRVFNPQSFMSYHNPIGFNEPKYFLLKEKNKRKDGKLKFNRRDAILQPKDVKMVR
ncbi:MAG TPA: hypothetical protein DCS93_01100 [Microscillaceae bacterium]|nr:hypothetical protein [Microscillaceae bacterium]